MKEAYLQKKLTELSEESQKISQQIKMRRNELETLEQRLGELKVLLTRLKKVEQFIEESMKELKEKNSELIIQQATELEQHLQKQIDDRLEHKSFLLNQTLSQLEKDTSLFQKNQVNIDEARLKALYVKEFHRLLMLKLINKGILTHREIKEIQLRSEKHIKQ